MGGGGGSVQSPWMQTPTRIKTPFPRMQTPPGFRPLPSWDTTGYDQQAGGTHPTGMHSCNLNFFKNPESFSKEYSGLVMEFV